MQARGGDGAPNGSGDVVGSVSERVHRGGGVEDQGFLLPAGDVHRSAAGLDLRLGEALPLRFGRRAPGRSVRGDEFGRYAERIREHPVDRAVRKARAPDRPGGVRSAAPDGANCSRSHLVCRDAGGAERRHRDRTPGPTPRPS